MRQRGRERPRAKEFIGLCNIVDPFHFIEQSTPVKQEKKNISFIYLFIYLFSFINNNNIEKLKK